MASIYHRGHLALLPLLLLFVSLPGFVAPAPINRKQVALRSEQVARQGLVHMIVFVKELRTRKTTMCLTNMPYALLTWSYLSNSCMHKNQLLVWQICHMPCSHDCQTDAHTKWFSLSNRCTHKMIFFVKQMHTQNDFLCHTDAHTKWFSLSHRCTHKMIFFVTQMHTQNDFLCHTDAHTKWFSLSHRCTHKMIFFVTQMHTQNDFYKSQPHPPSPTTKNKQNKKLAFKIHVQQISHTDQTEVFTGLAKNKTKKHWPDSRIVRSDKEATFTRGKIYTITGPTKKKKSHLPDRGEKYRFDKEGTFIRGKTYRSDKEVTFTRLR